MTPTQAIWGNGFHRGTELGFMIGALVVGIFLLLLFRKKDYQPPISSQPALQY